MIRFNREQPVDNTVTQFRSQYTILMIITLLVIVLAFSILEIAGFNIQRATNLNQISPFLPLILVVGLLVIYMRNIRRDIVNNLLASILTIIIFFGSTDSSTFSILVMITALSIAIISTNDTIFLALVIALTVRYLFAISALLYPLLNRDVEQISSQSVGFIFGGAISIMVALLVRVFIQRLQTASADARRSARLLEASADIGQSMSQVLELDPLLDRAVEIIRDRFAFYHVQVFLVDDEREYAYLRASTGEIGEQMLARQHRLRIDSNSVVGRVSQAGEPIIARDTDRDGRAYNELLPDTRSELGIPILDNQGIIGTLDMQSRRGDAFNEVEIRVLQVIANQLATAIQNARLFATQAHNIRENKRLFIESETNLREIQRLNRQLTHQAWEDYLKTDRRVDGVTLTGQDFSNRAVWSDSMLQASQRRRAIRGSGDDKNTVAVPIELRGEVIGAIEIETSESQAPEDVMDMAQAISQRLAVSLDNARLFEEAHEATAQEERIGELVSEYQSADSIDDLLKITLEGLAETLGADSAAIRISTRISEDTTASDTNPAPNGGLTS